MSDFTAAFWIVGFIAVFLIGISKSGFAGGTTVIATPLLALVMPVADAAAILLPLLIIADVINLFQYRRKFDRASLLLLLPAAVIGIVIGALFFNYFADNDRMMRLGIGILALLFLLYELARSYLLGVVENYHLPRPVGVLLGAIAGFTSTLAHAGAPPILIYLIPQKLERQIYVGTIAYLFLIVNVVKLVPYGMLGLLRIGNLTATLLLAPAAYIGVKVGFWLIQRVSERAFWRIIYVMLFLTAIQLILGRSIVSIFTS